LFKLGRFAQITANRAGKARQSAHFPPKPANQRLRICSAAFQFKFVSGALFSASIVGCKHELQPNDVSKDNGSSQQ
jgi:hypothetical protein